MGRHFEAVGILVIKDGSFFDGFCHSFVLLFNYFCIKDADPFANVAIISYELQKMCKPIFC